MPKVVSNTTPILSLLKIGKLNLLKDLYQSVLIPLSLRKKSRIPRVCPALDTDILIAAYCIKNNLTLITNNTNHYKDIKGLQVDN